MGLSHFAQASRAQANPGLLRKRLPRSGIVAGSSLNFVVLLVLNFDFAIAAVERGIGGRVADVVLTSQFGRDLVEGFFQFVEFVSHVDDAPSGGLGQLVHFAFA